MLWLLQETVGHFDTVAKIPNNHAMIIYGKQRSENLTSAVAERTGLGHREPHKGSGGSSGSSSSSQNGRFSAEL